MRKTGEINGRLALFALAISGICSSMAASADVLFNGNLETPVAPKFWTVSTSITGVPGATLPSAVEFPDASPDPGYRMLLHPQKGNQGIYEDQNKQVNVTLDQVFESVVAGRTYTFSGDSFLQDGYSGIVTTLNPLFPKADYNSDTFVNTADYVAWRMQLGSDNTLPQEGPNITAGMVTQEDYTYWRTKFGNAGRPAGVTSPTQTNFEITFLNSSNQELGSTTSYDLRSDPTTLAWRTGTDKVIALAPTGATKARLRVSVQNMVDNCCALGQDVLFDNFKLTDSAVPGANRLVNLNGDLNIPGEPGGWTVSQGPTVDQGTGPKTAATVAFIGFANRLSNTPNPNPTPPFATLPTGKQGLWLKGFVNTTQFEPDILDDFGYISQVVPGTPGAQYSFSAWSAWESGYCGSLANSGTQTFLKIEFLNGLSVIGTQLLDLYAAGQRSDDNTGTNENGGNVEFDDWRQYFLNAVAPNNTTNVRVSVGATGMFDSTLGFQSAFFDEMSLIETLPGSATSTMAVPEPASAALFGIAFTLAAATRRRKR